MAQTSDLLADPATRGDIPLRDGEGAINPAFALAVAGAVEAADADAATRLAGDLHEADAGALLEALDPELRPRLIELLGANFDFAALTQVDDAIREEILDDLPTETVAEGVRELESDDAVTILEDLDEKEQGEVLRSLPAGERVALQTSLDYPEASAGRLMRTELVIAPPFWTVGQTIDFMRESDADDLPDSFFEVFVVDTDKKLLGNVFLDRLARSKRPVRLDAIMDPDRRRVGVGDDREEVARLFERYNLISVPVVDAGQRLMGVVTIDDIVDVIEEEADEDLKALGGVKASEELSDSVWSIARSRFTWLIINLATAFLASSVLKLFEGQLEKMVALAILAPIVASQGGNAATQTMTVAVRALATRDLTRANATRIILRELMVGMLNGAAFGLITGLVAGFWFSTPGLGIVIALAMLTNLIAGALGGILIPIVLDRWKIDPAVSSGAFVTTVTDVVGNFAFLGIATLWFGLA